MPKQKAIGTPAARQIATKPMRNRGRDALPIDLRGGDSVHSANARAAINKTEMMRSRRAVVRSAYTVTMHSIITMPKGMAATRKVLGMLSAADVIAHSS